MMPSAFTLSMAVLSAQKAPVLPIPALREKDEHELLSTSHLCIRTKGNKWRSITMRISSPIIGLEHSGHYFRVAKIQSWLSYNVLVFTR